VYKMTWILQNYPSYGIDRVILAEMPCPIDNPKLNQCVKEHMIHGPCGIANKSLSCMINGKCSRFYPKNFQPKIVIKNDISLDNRFVVPYNPKWLLKYQAHINV